MLSTTITPGTAAAIAGATTLQQTPELFIPQTSHNKAPTSQEKELQQLVVKEGDITAIVYTYRSTAQQFGLNERCNVLSGFNANAYANKGFIRRTFFRDRGAMLVCETPHQSKFEITIEGFLDTFSEEGKNRNWHAEVKGSVIFSLECIKHTLYFIETSPTTDITDQLAQYKAAFEICSSFKAAAYGSKITSLTDEQVQTKFADIQHDISKEIGRLVTLHERGKIQTATGNMTQNADSLLMHLQIIILKTLFDKWPPRDLFIDRHLEIFRNPNIDTCEKFKKSGADNSAKDYIKNDEMLAFIKYLCTNIRPSKAYQKIAVAFEETMLQIEQGDSFQQTQVSNPSDTQKNLQGFFQRKEIVKLKEDYDSSLIVWKQAGKKFVNSKTLSSILTEIIVHQDNSYPYSQWIENALLLIGDWTQAKINISTINNIAQGTGSLAPLVCGDSNVLVNTHNNLKILVARTENVVSSFRIMATNVRHQSKILKANDAWNRNTTSIETQNNRPIAWVIQNTSANLRDFNASIEPQYVSNSVKEIGTDLLQVAIGQFLDGQNVSLPGFVNTARQISTQLDYHVEQERRAQAHQTSERRKLLSRVTGGGSSSAPNPHRIANQPHTGVTIEEIVEENESPNNPLLPSFLTPNQSHTTTSSQPQEEVNPFERVRPVTAQQITDLETEAQDLRDRIATNTRELAQYDHSNDFSFKVFKFKGWWLPIWATVVGFVGHLILMAGAGIYRLAKTSAFNNDERMWKQVHSEISKSEARLSEINQQISSLQSQNNITQQSRPVIVTTEAHSSTHQMQQRFQDSPSSPVRRKNDEKPQTELAKNSYNNTEIPKTLVALEDNINKLDQHAAMWLAIANDYFFEEFNKIKNKIHSAEDIMKETFCSRAFEIIERDTFKIFPQNTRKVIIQIAFNTIDKERKRMNAQNNSNPVSNILGLSKR